MSDKDKQNEPMDYVQKKFDYIHNRSLFHFEEMLKVRDRLDRLEADTDNIDFVIDLGIKEIKERLDSLEAVKGPEQWGYMRTASDIIAKLEARMERLEEALKARGEN